MTALVPMTTLAFSAISHSTKQTRYQDLFEAFRAEPTDLIAIKSTRSGRGVYILSDISKDDMILKVPLASCLRDDSPPQWYACDENQYFNPSKWATRLAAALLDIQINSHPKTPYEKAVKSWIEMMPDEENLRRSLPIHWSEEELESAKCSSLELAVDSGYFVRAEAVQTLMSSLEEFELEHVEQMCHHALDLIQTRSCRVERKDGIQLFPQLRILAPIFDFINHGSSSFTRKGSANAYFTLEGDEHGNGEDVALVVRARRNLSRDDEILIDYGASARPAWRCLYSYGFVPAYRSSKEEDEPIHHDYESVAEFYMHGSRYEVTEVEIPTSLVEAAYAAFIEEKDGARAFQRDIGHEDIEMFNPQVALRIAKRASDAAFDLLIQSASHDDFSSSSIATIYAEKLRVSQHHVLMNFAIGLRDYAENQNRTVEHVIKS